ncbi:MAG: hypothetical protein NVS2B8_20180 [Vulcanimicrobiaceae bacterium]
MESTELAIVVTRYDAVERDVPDERDLEALPYGRVVDVLALAPFVVPSLTSGVSDRGLGGGRGLAIDNGAPLADLATGNFALVDDPDRAARALAIERATRAYRYGPGAGGGLFTADTLAPGARALLDAGSATAIALAGSVGNVRPNVSLSDDDGLVARRAEVDQMSSFAGGVLRAGVSVASESRHPLRGENGFARNVTIARVAYATASRRYRTFASLSLANVALAFTPTREAYRSTYASASFRVERPGPVALAAGAVGTLRNGTYGRRGASPYDLVGRTLDGTAYAEAHVDGATSLDAGVGFVVSSARDALTKTDPRGSFAAVVPSLQVRRSIGDGTFVRVAYSQATRTPSLLEADAAPEGATVFERSATLETAIGFDGGGRVRGEAIGYRELAHGFAAGRLEGIGANLAWQIAPLVSVRAWTLRTTPLATQRLDATRSVLWLSYENPSALRVDALLVRDVSASHSRASLDADAIVPIRAGLSLSLSTVRRDNGRRFAIGVRVR